MALIQITYSQVTNPLAAGEDSGGGRQVQRWGHPGWSGPTAEILANALVDLASAIRTRKYEGKKLPKVTVEIFDGDPSDMIRSFEISISETQGYDGDGMALPELE